MKHTKTLVAALSLLALGACAKQAPPVTVPPIPVELVNVEVTQIVIPAKPDTTYVETIEAGDDAREALDIMTTYAVLQSVYGDELMNQLRICTADNYEMLHKLGEVKKFILLNQGQALPAPK